jgi:hypothetical protein
MQYVRNGKVLNLPKKWTFEKEHRDEEGKIVTGPGMKTGNFDLASPEVILKEGFLPVTVVNNEDYDPEIQTRTGPVITENADHAVLDYTVTNKPLAGIKKAKKKQIKQESKAMIAAKYDETDELSRKFMTPAEETSMDTARDADIATLTNYFKTTIKTKLAAANTPQKVKDLSYTWPTI